MTSTLVLASASPARRQVLRAAGIDPVVRVSDVDEDAVAAALPPDTAPATVMVELARAKAAAVAADIPEYATDCVVVGCDSMLLLDGELQGKPHTPEVARARWAQMAGRSAELVTGHCVLRLRGGAVVAEATDCSATTVHFAKPEPEELDAYLASGEPLQVAGAFTLDGLGGWFVDRIEGDPSSVIGIGLPLLRRLLGDVGVGVAQLWRHPAR
ncbi:septum formation inhibitor Maf [Nocardia farcinica]|uniref:nucleoside triphosphate pyrophosphatase n=1 Tax=Nocardia farcinica TaxID=37329 RepID=UPI0018931638|nr:nucleoside triphosphate pyrophosphatase [Nocardia farcinica]MBF6263140.1 septum formation inhibitor Maf [Nocardia farcinica]MBF6281644.1 septum formation inhibitor Maf [Nocardia farcinica]MBF6305560.1 septum formation inhibitor Maf [Nocardia farcinica]MBF6390210.1 septum formation inhibitor Maf [Nocardia farcinica]MBF6491210.1 septum formation inhibitor Maf [Nocardia farcinica]